MSRCSKPHPRPNPGAKINSEILVHKYCLTQVWCACLWLAARLMTSRRSSGPVVLCVQTEGGHRVRDDEAWSVWYWPEDVTSWLVGDITLAGLRCTSILEPGYSLSMGSFLSSSPPLAFSPSASCYFHFLSSPLLIPSSFLSLPLVSLPSFFVFFFPFLLCLHCSAFPFPLSSLHSPSWIKLFIWPKPQPAGKQAVSTEARAEDQQLQTTLYRAGMKHVSHW